MSLEFDGGAVTDSINVAYATSLATLWPSSHMMWVYLDTWAGADQFFSRILSGWTQYWHFIEHNIAGTDYYFAEFNGTGGAATVRWLRSSFDIVGKWAFVAIVCDESATEDVELYIGDLTTPVAKIAQDSTSYKSGYYNAINVDFTIGNYNEPITQDQSIDGKIAFCASFFGTALTLEQLKTIQYKPINAVGIGGCDIFYFPGLVGSASVCSDLSGSGNNSHNTGLVVADHVPLGPPFAFDDGYDILYHTPKKYVEQSASGEIAAFQFQNKNANNTDPIAVLWRGKTNLAPSSKPVIMEVYNQRLHMWEEVDRNDTEEAGREFELTANLS